MTLKLFCFGQGYSADALVRHLKQQNTDWQVSGTDREGKNNFLFDGAAPMADAFERLCDVTHMLISIPPQGAIGDPVLKYHRTDISQLKKLEWLGYLSTTGVYGDRGGAWVNDKTDPTPTSERGQHRLAAERGWLDLCCEHQIPVHIFRLGSIYGPGRGYLANLLSGRVTTVLEKDHFFSRIHVDDLVRVLAASMSYPCPGRSYNVADDRPAPSHEVMDYICDLLDRPPLPRTEGLDMSVMMKSFYLENKRVDNARIKQELSLSFKYPSYKEGFTALIRQMSLRPE